MSFIPKFSDAEQELNVSGPMGVPSDDQTGNGLCMREPREPWAQFVFSPSSLIACGIADGTITCQ